MKHAPTVEPANPGRRARVSLRQPDRAVINAILFAAEKGRKWRASEICAFSPIAARKTTGR